MNESDEVNPKKKRKKQTWKVLQKRAWVAANLNHLSRTLAAQAEDGVDHPYIYGLDLSITGTGIVILDQDAKVVHTENVTLGSGSDYERLIVLYKTFRSLFEKYPPSIVGWELISVFRNPMATIKLAMVVSTIFCAATDAQLKLGIAKPYLTNYVTTQVKKIATGGGKASKEEVVEGVAERFGEEFETDDEADAYCVARATHLLAKLAQAWDSFRKKELKGKGTPEDFEEFGYTKKIDTMVAKFCSQKAKVTKDFHPDIFEVVISRFSGPNILNENNYAESRLAWSAIKQLGD